MALSDLLDSSDHVCFEAKFDARSRNRARSRNSLGQRLCQRRQHWFALATVAEIQPEKQGDTFLILEDCILTESDNICMSQTWLMLLAELACVTEDCIHR